MPNLLLSASNITILFQVRTKVFKIINVVINFNFAQMDCWVVTSNGVLISIILVNHVLAVA